MSAGRVFVVGSTGWIGGSLCSLLPDPQPIHSHRVVAEGQYYLSQLSLGPGDVIINAAGSKSSVESEITAVNVDLVRELLAVAGRVGARVVQLGSAAEYGLANDPGLVAEDAPANPQSLYGRTKLAATNLVLASGTGTVLRVFNVVAGPPQVGSPLADVLARTEAAARSGRPAEVMAAGTVRDWVSKAFVLRSLHWASQHPVAGLYNVSSGRPVSMADIVAALLAELGSDVGVRDLRSVPASRIVGDSSRWRELTGMAESLDPAGIAKVVLQR